MFLLFLQLSFDTDESSNICHQQVHLLQQQQQAQQQQLETQQQQQQQRNNILQQHVIIGLRKKQNNNIKRQSNNNDNNKRKTIKKRNTSSKRRNQINSAVARNFHSNATTTNKLANKVIFNRAQEDSITVNLTSDASIDKVLPLFEGQSFPFRLWYLINHEFYDDVIKWSDDGNYVVIMSEARLD